MKSNSSPALLVSWSLLSAQQPKVVPCGGQVHLVVAAGGRALSSASSEPAMWDCVCGLPGVRECMPMATTGRPNRYPKATKPANPP
jgi:hypothetical protein